MAVSKGRPGLRLIVQVEGLEVEVFIEGVELSQILTQLHSSEEATTFLE